MQVVNYKVDGEEHRAADIASLIAQMDNAERFQGATEAKIFGHWYEMKQALAEALLTQPEAPQNEKEEGE